MDLLYRKVSRRHFTALSFIAAAAFMVGLGLLQPVQAAAKRSLVTPEQASLMISEGAVDLVLDVRTPGEYTGELGHIKGAKLIPHRELQSRLGELAEYRDKNILVYCHSGGRSSYAQDLLKSSGFSSVYDLRGGITSWKSKGLQTVR